MSTTEESKTARHERIKGARNPWEMLPEILGYAAHGFSAVPEEDFNVRLRWWGLYPQGDGAGAKGGVDPFFMLRLRIPGGRLTTSQFRLIGNLSERFARGTADITVRQNIQFHWIPAENLPEVFQNLFEVGLTSMGACGDDTRNITTCPISGLDPDPDNDFSDLVEAATRELNGNPLFYNLPRKFKITLSGCSSECTYPEINDVGITPVRHEDGRKGFRIQVGGGLSTRPHFAVPLNVFLTREQIIPVLAGIASLFRDREELRQKRERARLKFLFLEHGWDRERFERELAHYLDFTLEPWTFQESPRPSRMVRDHVGFFPQKGEEEKVVLGLPINQGVLSPDLIAKLSNLAEQFGSGEIRLTPQQNLLIPGIPDRSIKTVQSLLDEWKVSSDGNNYLSRTVSCTGKTYCRLALVETKEWSRNVAERLDQLFPAPQKPVNIHVTGCPNDCGQQRIAEIGLQGVQFKGSNGILEDGFDLFLGGQTGTQKSFNTRSGIRVGHEEAPLLLAQILEGFEENGEEEETFKGYIDRIGVKKIREIHEAAISSRKE
ncbi:MAG: nitrite/sulfite reductase [Leptospirales bacterium]